MYRELNYNNRPPLLPAELVPDSPTSFGSIQPIPFFKVSFLDPDLFIPLVHPSTFIAPPSSAGMDYSYFPQTQAYDFYTLPQKPLHPYTTHADFANDSFVRSSCLQKQLQSGPDIVS